MTLSKGANKPATNEIPPIIDANSKEHWFGKKSKNTFGFLRPTEEIDFPFFHEWFEEVDAFFGPNDTTHEIDS